MLTASQLRQSAALSGVRDIASIEIDVVLTHLPQLFQEHGLTEHLAFKGGTPQNGFWSSRTALDRSRFYLPLEHLRG